MQMLVLVSQFERFFHLSAPLPLYGPTGISACKQLNNVTTHGQLVQWYIKYFRNLHIPILKICLAYALNTPVADTWCTMQKGYVVSKDCLSAILSIQCCHPQLLASIWPPTVNLGIPQHIPPFPYVSVSGQRITHFDINVMITDCRSLL